MVNWILIKHLLSYSFWKYFMSDESVKLLFIQDLLIDLDVNLAVDGWYIKLCAGVIIYDLLLILIDQALIVLHPIDLIKLYVFIDIWICNVILIIKYHKIELHKLRLILFNFYGKPS